MLSEKIAGATTIGRDQSPRPENERDTQTNILYMEVIGQEITPIFHREIQLKIWPRVWRSTMGHPTQDPIPFGSVIDWGGFELASSMPAPADMVHNLALEVSDRDPSNSNPNEWFYFYAVDAHHYKFINQCWNVDTDNHLWEFELRYEEPALSGVKLHWTKTPGGRKGCNMSIIVAPGGSASAVRSVYSRPDGHIGSVAGMIYGRTVCGFNPDPNMMKRTKEINGAEFVYIENCPHCPT